MKSRMKHVSLFSASALLGAATLAAPAMAATTSHSRTFTNRASVTSGVVISKNVLRHTLVVTSMSGLVRTIRLSSGVVAKARLGEKINSRTIRLADGTYKAAAITSMGHATKAKVRATIVASHSGRTLLSAGGSVFVVLTGRAAHDQSTNSSSTGEVVEVSVDISQNSLDQTGVQSTGQTNLIGLDGVLSAVSATSLTIAVEDGANTTIAVPLSLTLPSTIAVGDRIEVLVDYSNQTFTLVTIKDDSLASNDQGQGVSQGDNQNLQVEGLVVAASATSVTVQPGDQAAAVTFAVPSTFDVSTIAVGDQVDAQGLMAAGVLTLSSFKVQQGDGQNSGDQQTTEITGIVTALSATSVTITSPNSSVEVTATIPSGFDTSSLVMGATIHLTADVVAGVLTVTHVEVPDAYSVDISGTVVSMSTTTIVLLSSDSQVPTSFTIPATLSVPSFAVGANVEVKGDLVGGVAVLTSLVLSN